MVAKNFWKADKNIVRFIICIKVSCTDSKIENIIWCSPDINAKVNLWMCWLKASLYDIFIYFKLFLKLYYN